MLALQGKRNIFRKDEFKSTAGLAVNRFWNFAYASWTDIPENYGISTPGYIGLTVW